MRILCSKNCIFSFHTIFLSKILKELHIKWIKIIEKKNFWRNSFFCHKLSLKVTINLDGRWRIAQTMYNTLLVLHLHKFLWMVSFNILITTWKVKSHKLVFRTKPTLRVLIALPVIQSVIISNKLLSQQSSHTFTTDKVLWW